MLYIRKKTITESGPVLPESPGDLIQYVSSTPINVGGNTTNFTNATDDWFIVFGINSTSTAMTVSANGANQTVQSGMVGSHGYWFGIWFFKSNNSNMAIALSNAQLGSWVIHRIRAKSSPLALTMRNAVSSSASTSYTFGSAVAQSRLMILWDRDVGSVTLTPSVGTTLHQNTYTYFEGVLVQQDVIPPATSIPNCQFNNLVNTYATFRAEILVNPA